MSYTKRKMFSAAIIGLLGGLSAMAWVYSYVMRQTGNNTKNSVVSAVVAGIVTFIVIVTIVWTIDSMVG